METNYQHWRLTVDAENILHLAFDRKDASVNTINDEVLDELDKLLDEVSRNNKLVGLILFSAKPKGFIAGADVKYFSQFNEPSAISTFLEKGQLVFNKLADLSIPTVAMIDGFCMGGGTEIALACRYRVAEDHDTKLGLPEILLGILPGWGGTVRLPQLIGPLQALPLILQGNAIRASKAAKIGMIDATVPRRQLLHAAKFFVLNKPEQKELAWYQSILFNAPIRRLLATFLRNNVSKKAKKAHYPAPYRVIDNWEKYGATGSKAFKAEIDGLASLINDHPTAKNLIRDFFLQERLKSFSKKISYKAQNVHVIGAGVMGGDIAAWCALSGLRVTLQDRDLKYIAPAIKRAYQLFKKRLKQPRLIQAAMDRLIPDVDGLGVKRADVIIEAIYENLEAKKQLFTHLEMQAKPDAILATNTSSIPLDEINTVLTNPERLVGIHFFNPVAKMKLVEVVKGNVTNSDIVDKAQAFVGQIGRLALPVASAPGFLVNRILMPYLLECMTLLDEGIPKQNIDKAATDFGMLMGPVELADTVGLDVCLAVAENLTSHYGGEIANSLQEKVKQGDLGRKTGRGLYQYKSGKPIKSVVQTTSLSSKEIADRLILRMVNEAAACLREGVVADADLLDAGMVFGTGFAPFRGGLMNYANDVGEEAMAQLFENLEKNYGKRFQIDNGFSKAIKE